MIFTRRNSIPTLVAAIGTAALLSGCGAAAAPTSGTTATTATTASAFNPSLVQTTAAGAVTVPTTTTKQTTKPKASSKSKAKSSSQKTSTAKTTTTSTGYKGFTSYAAYEAYEGAKAQKAAAQKAATTAAAQSSTPSSSSSDSSSTPAVTHTTTTPAAPPKPVWPPVAPFSASAMPALALTSFTTPGNNIGCTLGGGNARCDILVRDWSPPRKPSSCTVVWGQGLTIGTSGKGSFVCAANSVLDPTGQVVANERDDTVDGATCQVRTVGVICFNDATRHGFWISRTGYSVF
jgi:hypothetical protein